MVTKGEHDRIRDILLDELYDAVDVKLTKYMTMSQFVDNIMKRITQGGGMLDADRSPEVVVVKKAVWKKLRAGIEYGERSR